METNNPKSVGFQGQRERERLPGSRRRRLTEINVKKSRTHESKQKSRK